MQFQAIGAKRSSYFTYASIRAVWGVAIALMAQ